jgi:hypothetical protein
MTKNIFVLFAPGLGGNHLSNIFSLDSSYRPRITDRVYDDQKKTAHIEIQNINLSSIEKNLDKLVDQNNVLCGHWSEYVCLKESNFIQHFPNRTFCVIQMPEVGSELCNRFFNWNKNLPPWLFNEITLLYKKEHVTKLIGESDSPFVYIHPDLLCNRDIKVLINDVNNQGLEIQVDLAKAQEYHDKWITNNFGNTFTTSKGLQL